MFQRRNHNKNLKYFTLNDLKTILNALMNAKLPEQIIALMQKL